MERLEHVREDPPTPCLCKDNLKKYSTFPIIGLAFLLLTNTALTITRHRGETSVNLCHNFTLPYDIPSIPLARTNVTNVKFREDSTHCLPQHTLHLGKDIYLSVCDYRDSIRVDIRRFTGDVTSEGIVPTIRGIYLSREQWRVLKVNVNFVDFIIGKLDRV